MIYARSTKFTNTGRLEAGKNGRHDPAGSSISYGFAVGPGKTRQRFILTTDLMNGKANEQVNTVWRRRPAEVAVLLAPVAIP